MSLKKLEETVTPSRIRIKALEVNPVDGIWGANRPATPSGSIRIHPLEYAGQSVKDKLTEVRKQMAESKARVLVLSALDEIAWTYNIRGQDVPCNPVTIAYAIITPGHPSSYNFCSFIVLTLLCHQF